MRGALTIFDSFPSTGGTSVVQTSLAIDVMLVHITNGTNNGPTTEPLNHLTFWEDYLETSIIGCGPTYESRHIKDCRFITSLPF
jgi:hypothetical protein